MDDWTCRVLGRRRCQISANRRGHRVGPAPPLGVVVERHGRRTHRIKRPRCHLLGRCRRQSPPLRRLAGSPGTSVGAAPQPPHRHDPGDGTARPARWRRRRRARSRSPRAAGRTPPTGVDVRWLVRHRGATDLLGLPRPTDGRVAAGAPRRIARRSWRLRHGEVRVGGRAALRRAGHGRPPVRHGDRGAVPRGDDRDTAAKRRRGGRGQTPPRRRRHRTWRPQRRDRSPQPCACPAHARRGRCRCQRHKSVATRAVPRNPPARRRTAHMAQGGAHGHDLRLRVARCERRLRRPSPGHLERKRWRRGSDDGAGRAAQHARRDACRGHRRTRSRVRPRRSRTDRAACARRRFARSAPHRGDVLRGPLCTHRRTTRRRPARGQGRRARCDVRADFGHRGRGVARSRAGVPRRHAVPPRRRPCWASRPRHPHPRGPARTHVGLA